MRTGIVIATLLMAAASTAGAEDLPKTGNYGAWTLSVDKDDFTGRPIAAISVPSSDGTARFLVGCGELDTVVLRTIHAFLPHDDKVSVLVRVDDKEVRTFEGIVRVNEIYIDPTGSLYGSLQNAKNIAVRIEHKAIGQRSYRFKPTETQSAWTQWVQACNGSSS